MKTESTEIQTGRVIVDKARIDRLKEQLMSTPQAIDNERVRIMAEVYEGTAGYQQIIREPSSSQNLLERKEVLHRREPLCGQHGEFRQRHLHLSGMERGVDEGGEYRREVEDPRKSGRQTSGRSSTGTSGR